ncbi:hypothetical protein G6F31_016394 [Rhizopus arrhizus]|nr:hypothetical protein G6F31_016394 [Rhizopus arrhizus]
MYQAWPTSPATATRRWPRKPPSTSPPIRPLQHGANAYGSCRDTCPQAPEPPHATTKNQYDKRKNHGRHTGRAARCPLTQETEPVPGRRCDRHRHRRGSLRLPRLRHRRGAGFQQDLLSAVRSGDRHAGGLWRIRQRHAGAAHRRHPVRPLRRPAAAVPAGDRTAGTGLPAGQLRRAAGDGRPALVAEGVAARHQPAEPDERAQAPVRPGSHRRVHQIATARGLRRRGRRAGGVDRLRHPARADPPPAGNRHHRRPGLHPAAAAGHRRRDAGAGRHRCP